MFEHVSPNFCRKYIINDQFRKTGQKITTFVQFCKRKIFDVLENCVCKKQPKFIRETIFTEKIFVKNDFTKKKIITNL